MTAFLGVWISVLVGCVSVQVETRSCTTVLIWYHNGVPRKLRALIADLEKAGFRNRGGKGRHQNFEHHKELRVTLSGVSTGDRQFDLKLPTVTCSSGECSEHGNRENGTPTR